MLPDRQAPVSLPIVPSTGKTAVFLGFVLVFCAIPIVATLPLFGRMPVVAVAWFAALLSAGLVAFAGWSSRNVHFELSPTGLRVRGSLFGRAIPRADLQPEKGRAVSIEAEPQLKPILRTFGTGLIGYGEGWFRLRNGDKALLYLTDRTHVVDLPTRKGYRILLSVRDPEHFLHLARRIWGAPEPGRLEAELPEMWDGGGVPLEPQ
jgi:Bacterial PH domain